MRALTVFGVVDGVMVAAPLVGAGYHWPEHQGILWALAIVVFVGGFLATVMGACLTSSNRRTLEKMEKYRVNQEPE